MPHLRAPALLLLALAALPGGEVVPLLGAGAPPPRWCGGFLSWEKSAGLRDGVLWAKSKDSRGGLTSTVDLDPQPLLDLTPRLRLRTLPGNALKQLSLKLADADGTTHSFRFPLPEPGEAFTDVLPADAEALGAPAQPVEPGKEPGLGRITSIALLGMWNDQPCAVEIQSVAAVPPDAAMLAKRQALVQRLAKQAEAAKRKAAEEEEARRLLLSEGAAHAADGVEVMHLCAVAPDVLAIVMQAGRQANDTYAPYQAQPGDEVEEVKGKNPDKDAYREVLDGKVVTIPRRAVFRQVEGKRTRVGVLSPDGTRLYREGVSTGQQLDERVVDEPAAYAISSTDDPAFAAPAAPQAVFRKGKPNGHNKPLPFAYTISLRLPTPLREGASYTVRFIGVNTREATATYRHLPRETRSLAVHAIQTGYRPDDPWKRAYVSFWMGQDREKRQASCTPAVIAFELIDASGRTVHTGRAEQARPESRTEQLSQHEQVDYTKAAVWRLDFSAFSTPGTYRVLVPGLGTSYPFDIAADVWHGPFVAAMEGIRSQRQGIDLGPPSTAFARKRTFHPDDGVQFWQLDITTFDGQEGARGKNLIELAEAGRLQRVEGVWGGHQDAGDWDSLSHHLSATYDLLETWLLNPEAVRRIRLRLPGGESANALPDIIDEALWQLALWQRLQLSDGAVRGGYGYGWGCPEAMASSMLRSAGVYAPDHVSTMRYAAAAARAARVLAEIDAAAAAGWLASAQRAWRWAEAHANEQDPLYARLKARKGWPPFLDELANERAAAAVELLAATRDAAFAAAYRQSTEILGEGVLLRPLQMQAAFAYARLPEGLGEPELKRRAVERIVAYADHALAWSARNAFDLLPGRRTDFPMIFACTWFSTPAQGGMSPIYAYELTREPRFLAAAVQGSNFCLGANPDNLSYCSGVGDNPHRLPYLVDARVTGQWPDVPVGHIPYGQGNEGNEASRRSNGWVQQWHLGFAHAKQMTPSWYDWPVYEQYVDFSVYPLHNENCFNQTTVPAALYWFWLANRPAAR